ncbi:MAG: phospholipase [Myxococcota bacterium]
MSLHTQPPTVLTLGDDALLTVIMAHGRNRAAEDMARVARRLDVPARYLLLSADDKTWYPAGFMADFDSNEPALSAAITHIETVVTDAIAAGTPAERLVVGGFSQGACLIAEWLARRPRRIGGALFFTGGLIGPEGTTWPDRPALSGMPAYLVSAENDAWVPASRVRETKAWMERSGIDLRYTMFEQRDHEISDPEIDAARGLLDEIAAKS